MGITEPRATDLPPPPPPPPPPTYLLSRWLFLRLLGVIYFIAFVSLALQITGLVGEHGILPARTFLERAHALYGGAAYRLFPTLCWLVGGGGGMLRALCWGGAVLALLVVDGVVRPLAAGMDAPRHAASRSRGGAGRAVAHLRPRAARPAAARGLRPARARAARHCRHGQLRVLQRPRARAVRAARRRRDARPRAAPPARGGRAPGGVGATRCPRPGARRGRALAARVRTGDRADPATLPGAGAVREPLARRRGAVPLDQRLRTVPRHDHRAARDRGRGQPGHRGMARVPLPLEARRRDPPATVRGAASAAAPLADVVRPARPRRRTGLAAPLRRPPAAGESGGRVAARAESLPGGAAPVRPARVLPLPLQHAGRAGPHGGVVGPGLRGVPHAAAVACRPGATPLIPRSICLFSGLLKGGL